MATDQVKRCSRCGEIKPLDAFSRSKKERTGRHSWCRVCFRAYQADPSRREQRRKYWTARCATDPEVKKKHRLSAARWKAANPERRKAATKRRNLRRLYGLTIEKVESIREAQNGACAICFEPFTKTPHVDHDHTTNLVRGLLCARCNLAMGYVDQPGLLEACADYLKRHKRSKLKAV